MGIYCGTRSKESPKLQLRGGFKHELREMTLMHSGMSQHEAHIEASKEYDYPRESNLYYENLGIKNSMFHIKGENSGGLSYEDFANDIVNEWEERY